MIPVVIIHFGEKPPFVHAVLAQGHARGNEIVFINPPPEAICQHPFAHVYQHMSTNNFYLELACMVRWFCLLDWLKANRVGDCFSCDSDVLLFANIDHEVNTDPYYREHWMTLSLGSSGHASYWRTDALELFCRFLHETYACRGADFKYLQRIHREMAEQQLPGGVSDMLLLEMYARSMGMRVGEMAVPRCGKVWDHNFNTPDAYILPNTLKIWDGFATERMGGATRKRIYFQNGNPYAMDAASKLETRFLSLHMQGGAKRWINEILRQANG